ncbi:MAG: IS21-like element helper ATPase IstB [Elusimicrobiota bacterium]
MLTHPTLDKLRQLKLYGMTKEFEKQSGCTDYDGMGFEERLGLIVDMEMTEKENRRLITRLRQARLRQQACMENIDYHTPRKLDKALIKSLGTCKWLKDKLNVLVTGSTGTGKSFISCSLGHRACLNGYRTLYFRATNLFYDLSIAKGDGRYGKIMKSISKADLLILDDWGLVKLSELEQLDLLEILEDRYGIHSTIISSQVPHERWHELMANPTLSDAILDRFIHNAYKIKLDGHGESMRKRKSEPL